MTKEKEEAGKKSTKTAKTQEKSKSFLSDERIRFIFGILITGFAFYLLLACTSYLFWWKTDQSLPDSDVISGSEVVVKNWSGKSGHFLAKTIIGYGFGYGAFFIPAIFGVIGLYLLNFPKIRPVRLTVKFVFAAILLSLIRGFLFGISQGYLISGPGGAQGYFITKWMNSFMGKIGTGAVLAAFTFSYLIFALGVRPSAFRIKLPNIPKRTKAVPDGETAEAEGSEELKDAGDIDEADEDEENNYKEPAEKGKGEIEFVVRNTNIKEEDEEEEEDTEEDEEPVRTGSIIHDFTNPQPEIRDHSELPGGIKINRPDPGDALTDQEVTRIMENYDPRLDLSHYKFPPVTLLKDHKSETAFDNREVFENKENIIKTLGDHKIAVKSITATIGPTVTLYEIVPERGVKIARIKSLEDDIALNLSALGIRIIAPIPGRGTVGIEVPNKKPEMVSMRSLITSKTFQESKYDIALALGRTITNDPYIVDLTKMPHLLVAGATGQGKSVGINAIITSILYKKHPSEVKFVLIDPKRVELPLYMKIERHFLAKLPDEEDAIITDTQKVIKTLNSLCIEMDSRLELLKTAQCRNIKEYNEKFIARRL
ncbi:MAG TPA: DNA translocase FtsK 4TM domain-containing protein, partial [Bacteroidales bacterium]|nr:DNA translocase FtsK 4TM domain-containing protein [Bacteroidales bacterium]